MTTVSYFLQYERPLKYAIGIARRRQNREKQEKKTKIWKKKNFEWSERVDMTVVTK